MTTFLRHRLWPAIALLLALTIVTGFLYPLVVTAVAQVAFPNQANGSFIQTADGRTIGSSLIGQAFSQPKYFWSRPSAAGVTDATGRLRRAPPRPGPTWARRTRSSSSASPPRSTPSRRPTATSPSRSTS